MKQIIHKILKENRQEKYYNIVINYIEKNNIRDSNELIDRFGLGENDIEYFEGEALRHLDELEGMSFNTNDYPSLSFGSYEFKFGINRVVNYETFYEGKREIEIDTKIISGILDIDDETVDVMAAAIDNDYGWEVQGEMQDCVSDIIRYLIPETVAGNLQIDVNAHA